MQFAKFITISLLCLIISPPLLAGEINLNKTVTLKSSGGETIDIGSIQLTRQPSGGFSYTLDIDHSKFSDHFLSMRPFKCFQGPIQMLCHLPYPYNKSQLIKNNDLKDLEYDLLFIHRRSTDYGINPWNGIYYQLTMDKQFNFTGELKEVDLDILASPPEGGITRPITQSDLNEADPDSHSYPVLLIQ